MELTKDDPMVCIVDGTYAVQGSSVIVTALPLRTYKEFTTTLAELIEKKIVSDYRNLSVDDNTRFEIEMCVDENGKLPTGNLMKMFRLRRIITMSNLVLLDERGVPKRYKSAEDILLYFHEFRLEFYERRRIAIIENLRKKVVNLDHRMRLLGALISEDPNVKIEYVKRPKADILAEMTVKLPDIPHSVYGELEVKHLNADELENLRVQLETARKNLADLQATTKEAMWKKDLLAFLREYRAIYGGVKNVSAPFAALPW